MKRKYKRFNNPPFYLADSTDELPEKIIFKLIERGFKKDSLSQSMEFIVWFKAYALEGLWGDMPFLLVSRSSIYGFELHDFKSINFADIDDIIYTKNQIVIQLNKKINGEEKLPLITAFNVNKSLVIEIGQKLKGLLEDYKSSLTQKVILWDNHGNEINGEKNKPKDQLTSPESQVLSKEDVEDSFKNASSFMKVYTVVFWLFVASYFIGVFSLNTWNPVEMYNKVSSKKDSKYSGKRESSSNSYGDKKFSSETKNDNFNSNNYCYKYEISYHAEASNGTGSGWWSSEFTIETKIENYDDLSEEAIRQLWYMHCADDSWDGWRYRNFKISSEGSRPCN